MCMSPSQSESSTVTSKASGVGALSSGGKVQKCHRKETWVVEQHSGGLLSPQLSGGQSYMPFRCLYRSLLAAFLPAFYHSDL